MTSTVLLGAAGPAVGRAKLTALVDCAHMQPSNNLHSCGNADAGQDGPSEFAELFGRNCGDSCTSESKVSQA